MPSGLLGDRKRAGAAINQCLDCKKALRARRCTDCRTAGRDPPPNTSMSEDFSDRKPPRQRPGSLCYAHKCKKCSTCSKLQKFIRSKSTSNLSSARFSMYGSNVEPKRCMQASSIRLKQMKKKRASADELTCQEQLKYLREKLKQKPRKLNIKPCYYYRYGNRNPIKKKCGHRECVIDLERIPAHMGWRWNVPILGINDVRVFLVLAGALCTMSVRPNVSGALCQLWYWCM